MVAIASGDDKLVEPSENITLFAGETSSPYPISLETIDYLIVALTRLKESKGVLINDSLSLSTSPDNTDSSPLPTRSEEVDFVSAYTRLRDLKKSGGVLSTVLQAVEHEISLQQLKCNPLALRIGIRSLPKDVLRYILEIGYETFDEDREKHHTFPIAVSGVSQYFRSVALATPRIWNRINTEYCVEHLETFIMRSGAVDLSVVVGAIPNDSEPPSQKRCSVEEFMAIATKHAARWSKFEYHSETVLVDGNSYIHPSLYSYPTLHLPRLSELTCCKHQYDARIDNIHHAPFFSGWDMPNLTHFYGLNTLLDWRVNKAPLLHFADIVIDPFINERSWHWQFRGFLLFAPQLSTLELMLSNLDWSDDETEFPDTVLPRLTKLAITINGVVATRLVTELFKAIRMPNLFSLSLKFTDTDVDQTRTDANAILRAILETTKPLGLFELDAKDHTAPLHDVLELLTSKLPSIHVLILRGSSIHTSSSEWPTHNDPILLRLVTLERCDGLDYYAVEQFAELVKDRPQWDNFRLIHIDCQSLRPCINQLKETFGHRLLDESDARVYLQEMKMLTLQ